MKISYKLKPDGLYTISLIIDVPHNYMYNSIYNAASLIKIDDTKYTEWLEEQKVNYSINSYFENYNGYKYVTDIIGISEEITFAFKLVFDDENNVN